MPGEKPVDPQPRKRGRPLKSAADAATDIRRAALKAFARGGFNGVSIQDIASMAGVAKPLVHYHFASKDALWEAAVGGAVADLRSEILIFQQALNAPVPMQDILRKLSRQLVVFASRYPELVHIVVDETGKGGPRATWLGDNLLLPGYRMARELLNGFWQGANAGGAAGELPHVEHIVPIVLGVMNFPFMDAEVVREAYGVDVWSGPYIEQHGEILYRIVLGLLSMDAQVKRP